MSVHFNWPNWDSETEESIRNAINNFLAEAFEQTKKKANVMPSPSNPNPTQKPDPFSSFVVAPIQITKLKFGSKPPHLFLQNLHSFSDKSISSTFRFSYNGDLQTVFKTKLQLNQVSPALTRGNSYFNSSGLGRSLNVSLKPRVFPLEVSFSNINVDGKVRITIENAFKLEDVSQILVSKIRTFGVPEYNSDNYKQTTTTTTITTSTPTSTPTTPSTTPTPTTTTPNGNETPTAEILVPPKAPSLKKIIKVELLKDPFQDMQNPFLFSSNFNEQIPSFLNDLVQNLIKYAIRKVVKTLRDNPIVIEIG